MSLQNSDGRPPQDGQFQNLKSVSTFVASKITASEINSNVSITGEIIAAGGSITNLSVDNLILANPGSTLPFPGFVALPLSVATVAGSTVAYSDTSAPLITLNTVNTDSATWSVFVPASGTQLKVYVPVKAALGSNTLSVSVNGVAHSVIAATLKSGTTYVYSTSAFDWKTSELMRVVISSSSGTGISIGDAPYIAV